MTTSPASARRGLVAAVMVWAVVADAATPLRAQSWPCDVRTDERIVAVGDVHGAYDRFAEILRAAGLIDARERWTGGRAILIQTGDVLDRGPDSRKAVDLLRKLERDASREGGRVMALLGNHELMRLIGDWRYVSEGEYQAFRTAESTDLRDRAFETLARNGAARAKSEGRVFDARLFRRQFEHETPLGALEIRWSFDATGDYGKWVRARPTVALVNGLVFLHGGLSEQVAGLGCVGLNEAIRQEMASLPLPPDRIAALLATSETGPLWHRGLALDPETSLASTLDTILQRMQARAIVVGHTAVLPGRIATRVGGKVVQLDTGMLGGAFFPRGVASALEIKGDVLTAVYVDRRERLATPALQRRTGQ